RTTRRRCPGCRRSGWRRRSRCRSRCRPIRRTGAIRPPSGIRSATDCTIRDCGSRRASERRAVAGRERRRGRRGAGRQRGHPRGAIALAKTRRYVAIVALGCVIRGETAHFEYVAGEAASGLQLAALETGVPVAFGVLTTNTLEQAMARSDKGAEAVRTALEMADLFNQIRATAKAS